MSYQEKNTVITLSSFLIILTIFLNRLFDLSRNNGLNSSELLRLWGTVIVLSIVFTIFAAILTYVVTTIIEVVRTGEENPTIEDFDDERDQLIELKGKNMAYLVTSLGAFLAMITFALGQSALIMFSLLLFFAIIAQIANDMTKLILYRRGF